MEVFDCQGKLISIFNITGQDIVKQCRKDLLSKPLKRLTGSTTGAVIHASMKKVIEETNVVRRSFIFTLIEKAACETVEELIK
jgi:hypothetical protein